MKRFLACFLAGVMVLGLCACGEPKTEVKPDEPNVTNTAEPTAAPDEVVADPILKELYAEHGLKVGTCINGQMINDEKYAQIIREQFNSVTCENAMKPDAICDQQASKEAGDIVINFGKEAVSLMEFAKENNMAMRGHTIVWYSQTPNWIFREGFDSKGDYVGRDEMLARMESFIKQVFEKIDELGYTDLFYAYDVVNEAWMEDGKVRSENNPWLDIIGEDYLWYAFYYADKYAPESINLFYNDYNEQFKTATLVKFVDTLKDEDGRYLIDGIGLQAHLYTEDDLNAYFRCIDSLSKTGLIIEMTELDVCLGAYQKELLATAPNRVAQGKFYYNLINGIFERIDNGSLKMDSLTFWGVSDQMSWRKKQSPLLYNARLQPKEAFYGATQVYDKAGFLAAEE